MVFCRGIIFCLGALYILHAQQSQRPADCDLADLTRSAFSTYELMLRQVKEAHLFRNLVRTSEGKI